MSAQAATQKRDTSMRTFLAVWFGQFVSMVGSNMTMFALGIWVFQQTGSITQYGLTILLTFGPMSIVAPIAGALIDRWDRRKIMILSDILSGVVTLVLAALLFYNQLQVWHIYAAAVLNAVAGSFQMPAYQATVTLIVPKAQYGRVAGLIQLAEALALLVAPPLAGLLLVAISIEGIILLDFVTFSFAMLTLAFVRFPKPPTSKAGRPSTGNLWAEILFGVRYLLKLPGFLSLTLYVGFFLPFLFGFVQTLITPLVLSFAEPDIFGLVIGAVGLGALVGGVWLAVWGGPKNRITGMYLFAIPYGLSIIIGGLRPDALLIGAAGFVLAISHAMVTGCNRALWHAKIAPDLQGRVFSLRTLTGVGAQALGTLVAGPMADLIFEPLMAVDGALAGSVGTIIGVGPGRGIALMFIILGGMFLLATGVAYVNPRIRHLESNIPDADHHHTDSGKSTRTSETTTIEIEEDQPQPEVMEVF